MMEITRRSEQARLLRGFAGGREGLCVCVLDSNVEKKWRCESGTSTLVGLEY